MQRHPVEVAEAVAVKVILQPDTGVSSNMMSIMKPFLNDILERIVSETSYNKRSTITSREIQRAVHLLLPGDPKGHPNPAQHDLVYVGWCIPTYSW
uniref:Core Histone H2A/H2B/H3 domain-containing protein n=1 Tax=Eptatretus burgeri TaxID=7764 RepID=A0A8C4Q1W0_EPTBU